MTTKAFKFLTNQKEIEGHIRALNDVVNYVVLDTETTSTNPRNAELVDIQLSGLRPGEVVMFSGTHAHLLKQVQPVFVVQNYKYDFHILLRHGVDLLDRPVIDPMLLHHILYPEAQSHSLASILEHYDVPTANKDFWEKYDNYLDAPFEERLEYACQDILDTDKAYNLLREDYNVRFSQSLPSAINRPSQNRDQRS